MLESKLYLIFDFIPMDLKRYMDSLGDGKQLDSEVVKSLTFQVLEAVLFFVTYHTTVKRHLRHCEHI